MCFSFYSGHWKQSFSVMTGVTIASTATNVESSANSKWIPGLTLFLLNFSLKRRGKI